MSDNHRPLHISQGLFLDYPNPILTGVGGGNAEDLAKLHTVFWGLAMPHTVTERPLRH